MGRVKVGRVKVGRVKVGRLMVGKGGLMVMRSQSPGCGAAWMLSCT